MAKYYTFAIIDYKKSCNVLVTSSARKAKKILKSGLKTEIWNENSLIDIVYTRTKEKLNDYIALEKEYIAKRQQRAEQRNKRKCKK